MKSNIEYLGKVDTRKLDSYFECHSFKCLKCGRAYSYSSSLPDIYPIFCPKCGIKVEKGYNYHDPSN